jgi:hypothetical protein
VFAALAPTVLGIDHAGLRSIYDAGDHTAFNLKLHSGSTYPLKTLAPTAAAVGLLALGAMRLTRNAPDRPSELHSAGASSHAQPALSS